MMLLNWVCLPKEQLYGIHMIETHNYLAATTTHTWTHYNTEHTTHKKITSENNSKHTQSHIDQSKVASHTNACKSACAGDGVTFIMKDHHRWHHHISADFGSISRGHSLPSTNCGDSPYML